MRLLGVVPASKIQMDDYLLGSPSSRFEVPDINHPLMPVRVISVFDTGHDRIQISTQEIGSGFLNSNDLLCVLRPVE